MWPNWAMPATLATMSSPSWSARRVLDGRRDGLRVGDVALAMTSPADPGGTVETDDGRPLGLEERRRRCADARRRAGDQR